MRVNNVKVKETGVKLFSARGEHFKLFAIVFYMAEVATNIDQVRLYSEN